MCVVENEGGSVLQALQTRERRDHFKVALIVGKGQHCEEIQSQKIKPHTLTRPSTLHRGRTIPMNIHTDSLTHSLSALLPRKHHVTMCVELRDEVEKCQAARGRSLEGFSITCHLFSLPV